VLGRRQQGEIAQQQCTQSDKRKEINRTERSG